MPTNVAIGQKWSVWLPSRRQWLLTTVINREGGQATLKYDSRYEVSSSYDEQRVDEDIMLTSSRLFQFIAS
jgi:hypothetical protein